MTMKSRTIMKAFLTLFIIVILAVVVFAFEKYLASDSGVNPDIVRHIRLREQSPGSLNFYMPDDYYMSRTDSLIQKKYRLEIDENGFIMPSIVHEVADLTVVFLGGSTTECIFVDEANRFPYLAGRFLENEERKVNSINSGVCSSNSMHSIDILLNKILPFQPDIAVMMHNVNDLNILLYEGSYWNDNPTRSLIVSENNSSVKSVQRIIKNTLPNLYRRSRILLKHLMETEKNDEFAHLRGKRLKIDRLFLTGSFSKNLELFIYICRIHGIIPVLMTQANRCKADPDRLILNTWNLNADFGLSYSQYKNIYDLFNDTIREVGKKNEVLVIDLAVEIPPEKEYIYDFTHFNDRGSRQAARVIADCLKANVLMGNYSGRGD